MKWMLGVVVLAGYCRALAIAAARCSAVGFSATQWTHKPSAVIASCVVGPMAANCRKGSSSGCQRCWRSIKCCTFMQFLSVWLWGGCTFIRVRRSPESLRTTSRQNFTPDGLKKAMLAGVPCECADKWVFLHEKYLLESNMSVAFTCSLK